MIKGIIVKYFLLVDCAISIPINNVKNMTIILNRKRTPIEIANVCIQSTINSFGSSAVAGSAAALNYEFFAYFLVNAFAQAAVTFTSQNYGAGEYNRCKKIFRISLVFALVSCGILSG